jgi:hypothetical protein
MAHHPYLMIGEGLTATAVEGIQALDPQGVISVRSTTQWA